MIFHSIHMYHSQGPMQGSVEKPRTKPEVSMLPDQGNLQMLLNDKIMFNRYYYLN